MDYLKKFAGGSSSSHSAGQPAGQKQDPVDKIFDKVSKKAGHDFSPSQDEKITDAGRKLYEKFTGKKVSSKISN
ncbi:hypothetical protein EsH8_VIII_001060 [Colletotrichum jinshuiense]